MESQREKLNRYYRFLDTEDAKRTLDEIDELFGLNQNVFALLGKPNGSAEQVIAKEGARAYSQCLRTLVSRAKQNMEKENGRSETDT